MSEQSMSSRALSELLRRGWLCSRSTHAGDRCCRHLRQTLMSSSLRKRALPQLETISFCRSSATAATKVTDMSATSTASLHAARRLSVSMRCIVSTHAPTVAIFFWQLWVRFGPRRTPEQRLWQLLLERPGRASAMAVQLPGPPNFWICSRRSASSCGIRRGVFGEGQHDDVHGDLRPRNTSRRCRGARNPDRSTPSSWRKTFPNGGLPRLGLAAPWPGRGSAPGNGAHLGSPRVLHDLVVVIGHVAHRRVRRVRRVRGCVCPRGFRGKFLTDCVTVGSKPDAEKKESRVGRKDAGPRLVYIFTSLFVHTRSVASIRSPKKSHPRFQREAHDSPSALLAPHHEKVLSEAQG